MYKGSFLPQILWKGYCQEIFLPYLIFALVRIASDRKTLARLLSSISCSCWFVIIGLLISVVLFGIDVFFRKKNWSICFEKRKTHLKNYMDFANRFKEMKGRSSFGPTNLTVSFTFNMCASSETLLSLNDVKLISSRKMWKLCCY